MDRLYGGAPCWYEVCVFVKQGELRAPCPHMPCLVPVSSTPHLNRAPKKMPSHHFYASQAQPLNAPPSMTS